ncbi:MAG: hypothetical protein PHC97_01495 [Patescibacteria group bacterium]|nr:hypothetical protein [Patescibacteria group bacterium]
MIFEKGDKFALISVFNKAGIKGFAQDLSIMGWRILSSGGTAKVLKEAGLKVTDVAELVGGKAILGHRVVTLSRELHASLLARYNIDLEEMENLGLPYIDLVCCDFYPLANAIAKPDATIESVIEMTDIGGPTMVRSAAKGGRIVICDPADRGWVLDELRANNNELKPESIQRLRAKAEGEVAKYCLDSARYHSDGDIDGNVGKKALDLAYGENKCQNPATLFSFGNDDPLALDKFKVEVGDPSYIAMADGNGVLQIMCVLVEAFRRNFGKVPYIVIAGKHGNPCGAAIDWHDPARAIFKALIGDKVAVMGGEVITNFPISDELGKALHKPPADFNLGRERWGLDLIIAPEFSANTCELMKAKKRRLLSNPALINPTLPNDAWMYKPVRGGFLRQRVYPYVLTMDSYETSVGPAVEAADLENLLIAWAICWNASSNTVALAKDSALIALGCGQQDRITCVRLCLERATRAGHDTDGSMFASDAFFPYASSPEPNLEDMSDFIDNADGEFIEYAYYCQKVGKPKGVLATLGGLSLFIAKYDNREGTELLIDAGCKGGVVVADGKELPKVIELFGQTGLSVIFVDKINRGFAKH